MSWFYVINKMIASPRQKKNIRIIDEHTLDHKIK